MIEWLRKVSLFQHLKDDQLESILRISRRRIPA
jgi:hypothetical protein